jgi:cyclic pyranopterin monophosphate synthase
MLSTFERSSGLTHIGNDGQASMVDVSSKDGSSRIATAQAVVRVGTIVHRLLAQNLSPGNKGSVFGVAQLAGIMAAKRTPDLIPLCHAVPLACVKVELLLSEKLPVVHVSATATTALAQTGVEMEALTAVSVAALTVYDMCKAVTKDMTITDIRLVSKSGGKSGDYRATDAVNS